MAKLKTPKSLYLKEHAKTALKLLPILLLTTCASVVYMTNNLTGPYSKVTGVITHAAISDGWYSLPVTLLEVDLLSGERVRSALPRHMALRMHAEVELEVYQRYISGAKVYVFLRYTESVSKTGKQADNSAANHSTK